MDNGYFDEEKNVYEVEVIKVLTYVVKVGACSLKEAAHKAVDAVKELDPTEAIEESVEATDVNRYFPEPDIEE